MSEELKPCPFCEPCNEVVYIQDMGEASEEPLQVFCYGCHARIDADEWNTRPIEDAKDAEIKRLQDIVDVTGKEFNHVEGRSLDIALENDELNARIAELEQQLAEARKANLRQRVEDIFFGDAFSESPKAGSPKIIFWALRKKDYIATRISSLIGVDMIIVGEFIESNRVRIPLDNLLDWIIEHHVEGKPNGTI